MRRVVLVLFLVLVGGPAFAGTIAESMERVIDRSSPRFATDASGASITAVKKHGFWDTDNTILLTAMTVTAITDVETTYQCFEAARRNASGICREGNPIFEPLVTSGRPAVYAGKAAIIAFNTVFPHRWRHSDSKTVRVIGWVLPMYQIVWYGYGTANNWRLRNEILKKK